MRQTFTFAESKHKPPQALAALKNRVRKYVKRERRKALPEGVDYWDFDCKVGETEQAATEVHISEVTNRMEAVFNAKSPTVYVEILAKPAVRKGAGKSSSKSSSKTTPAKSIPKAPSRGRVAQAKFIKTSPKPAKPAAERPGKAPVDDVEEVVPSSDWSFG